MKTAKEMFEELGYEKTDLLSGKSVHYESKKYDCIVDFSNGLNFIGNN